MTRNSLLLLLTLVLTSCGFSSNYYQEILKAQDYIDDKNYVRASEVYEKILKQKLPKVIKLKIHYQLAEINSIYLNNYKKAVLYYSQLSKISHEPSWHIKSYEKLGEIYFDNLKDYKKSYEIYSKLLDFKPELKNKLFYQYKLSQSLLKMGRYKDSLKQFKKVVNSKNSSLSNESLYYLGLNYFYLRQWKTAIQSWFKYLKFESRKDKVTKTKFLIANAYENNEELKRAYNMYYSLLGKYPNNKLIKDRLESLYNRRVARKR